MNSNFISLEEIRFAQPCRADWDKMTGDERARFCGSCHKNVYDLSQMTREQARQLIAEKEGHLCLRLHRRADGTVITNDCPVGATAASRPLWWGMVALMALLSSGLVGCGAPRGESEPVSRAAQRPAQGALVEVAVPAPTATALPVDEVPATDLNGQKPVPITNGPPSQQHAGVTMGAPLPIAPTATPQSTPAAYSQGVTLGRIARPPQPDEQG